MSHAAVDDLDLAGEIALDLREGQGADAVADGDAARDAASDRLQHVERAVGIAVPWELVGQSDRLAAKGLN